MPTFPSDLKSGVHHYMSFQFIEYNRMSPDSVGQLVPMSGEGNIVLPMPDRINDVPSVVWGETTLNPVYETVMGSALGQFASYMSGQTLNPFLVMLFKRPNFKEFSFTWNFAPRSEKETNDLQEILSTFRRSMLPTKGIGAGIGGTNGATLKYPKLLYIKFDPQTESKLFKFKPCAVKDIHFDYTGAGMPAFFKNTNGPAQVRMTLNVTEVEYWVGDDPQLM